MTSRIVTRAAAVALAGWVAACATPESGPGGGGADRGSASTSPSAAAPIPPPPDPPPFEAVDADGRTVDPVRSSDGRAVVLVFARSDCPISNRYAPIVRELTETYVADGVRFWLVFSDPDETTASIETHLEAFDFGAPWVRDVGQDLARWAGARVTPEAVVYVPGAGVVYRGRIDDRYVAFGRSRPDARRRDVADVLDRILAGDPPRFHTTDAVGCAIRIS